MQNSKCRLCGKRDETVNHIISKCSKLAQKECKNKHDWGGEGNPLEIVQKNEISQYWQMVCPRKWDASNSLGYWLVGWVFGFIKYQLFSGHLTLN